MRTGDSVHGVPGLIGRVGIDGSEAATEGLAEEAE